MMSTSPFHEQHQVTQKVSTVRVFAKALHWLAIGWTVFSWLSFVFTFFEAVDTNLRKRTLTAGSPSLLLIALRHESWGLFWLFPVLGAELLAFGLSRIAGPATPGPASSKEWLLGFVVALVPNAILAIRLFMRLWSLLAAFDSG